MFVLFVGGPMHGDAEHIANDIQTLEVPDPLEVARHRYDKHKWQRARNAHDFDALFIGSKVLHSEYEAKILDALQLAKR